MSVAMCGRRGCDEPADYELVARWANGARTSARTCLVHLPGALAAFQWLSEESGVTVQVEQRFIEPGWTSTGSQPRCFSCFMRPRLYPQFATTIDERDNVNCAQCGVTLRVIDG